jgi:hypothetical protein
MRDFLVNLAFMAIIVIVLFILMPAQMRQTMEIYAGLGLVPVLIVVALVKALPRRSKSGRR